MSKELVKKQDQALMTMDEDIFEYAGAGQAQDVEDFAIPMLTILQSGSPQLKKQRPEYIKEAEDSMIINSVTNELFDGEKGVVVLRAHYEVKYIEWIPREENGGLVAIYDREEGQKKELTTTRGEKGQSMLPNGNTLEKNMYNYVVVVKPNGDLEKALITFKSTQLKKGKKWNTLLSEETIVNPKTKKVVQLPSFAVKYNLSTVPESNQQGDWFGWKIERVGRVEEADRAAYQLAKEFHNAIKAGEVKLPDPETEDEVKSNKPTTEEVSKVM